MRRCIHLLQYSLVEYGESISQIAGKDQWQADQSWDITLEKELQIPELLKSSAPQFPPPGYHNGHLLLHFSPNPNPKPEANTKVCHQTRSWNADAGKSLKQEFGSLTLAALSRCLLLFCMPLFFQSKSPSLLMEDQ